LKIYNTIKKIQTDVSRYRSEGKSIGFVPTMGALHEGHLSLLKRSIAENDISIASIFVNPIQFNNKKDLKKYPRTLDEDFRKLEEAGCNIVFSPSVEEMYPEEVDEKYDFGKLELVMEGEHRPGHFNGVAVVVKRLFDICLPDLAYFGEKDFQQLMIIKELVKQEQINVQVTGCPIIREDDGLAMSSRNVRLSEAERSIAPGIYKIMREVRQEGGGKPLEQSLEDAVYKLNNLPGMKLEYIKVADEETLLDVKNWDEKDNLRLFVAVFLGDVRLIDNLKIK